MIKMAPVLIEFGDGDTGFQIGTTDEGHGCMVLSNGEPGEIGRELASDPPEEKIGAYIVFKNVKSLDCFIKNLQKLRDHMITEGTATSSPLKRPWVCETCRWSVNEHDCDKHHCDFDCPNYNDDELCRCTTVKDGAPCPYFEKWEEVSNASNS